MKVYLTRRYTFPASHRLHSSALSEAQNREIYGKCNNPHGHGHNYALEVTLAGPVNKETGMLCDLAELDEAVEREVLSLFDHADLNMVPRFSGRVPTTENLCAEIYDILSASFPVALEKIRLEETSNNSFEYAGGREIKR